MRIPHNRWAWGSVGHGVGGDLAPTPVLVRLNPDYSGDWDAEVHALGSDFIPEAKLFVGENQWPTTFVSDSDLSTVVPQSAHAGTYTVSVRQGGKISNELQFTVLA